MEFRHGAKGYIVCRSAGKTYSIDIKNNTCTCPDFVFRCYKEPGRICKHIREWQEIEKIKGLKKGIWKLEVVECFPLYGR